ncbi:MAG: ribosomal RNA small subunit methyltransferase A [Bacilli bacterium]|nr:ribosomal RNA small subunit methyltransferase A [Bacilli bacterium]
MQAKKSLGQNFLKNDTIIQKIVSLFMPKENDLIIEIGPGRGALTKKLCNLPSKLICIEIDEDMHEYLDRFESDNCHIIYDDILNNNLNDALKDYSYDNLYVIGNLPYYITSPIITHLINSGVNIKEMVFMVQNEVANRFCSTPGNREYGYVTLFINYYYDVKKELFVSKDNFNPVPKVDSAVIKLTKKNINYDIDESKYFNFLKKAFQHKRKTLKNNLTGYDFNVIKNVLLTNNLDERARPEDISQEIFLEIFKSIF